MHGRPSSRSSERSGSAGPLNCAFTRRPSSGGSRGPLVPASRAGAARAAAILLISCHLQATKDGNKHRRTLSDVAEGSSDGLGRRSTISFCLCRSFGVSCPFVSIRCIPLPSVTLSLSLFFLFLSLSPFDVSLMTFFLFACRPTRIDIRYRVRVRCDDDVARIRKHEAASTGILVFTLL